jgi:serine/threonine-protein kinase
VLKGRFVLKQPIGGGATGVVYRAHDRRPGLHPAQIAVKVLHEELQREQVTLARVRHAFAVNQSLEHPNIAQVYDFYRDEQYGFYTMELLDGESLRRLIELLGPEPARARRGTPLIRDMGAALTSRTGAAPCTATSNPRTSS